MLLSIKQVASKLNLKYDTVYWHYIRPGKIKSYKLDGVYRIREEDLEAYLKSKEYKPDEPL